MEIRIPLNVTHLGTFIAGLFIGCSFNLRAGSQTPPKVEHSKEEIQAMIEYNQKPLEFTIVGSKDPCIANIEKYCYEIDSQIFHHSPNDTGFNACSGGVRLKRHNDLFGIH